jgi:CHAT domain-containing protein
MGYPEVPSRARAEGGRTEALDRLSHVDREILSVGASVDGAVMALGPDASELRFRALAPRFRILHLSSHGVVDEEVPLYSGVQLAPDSSHSEDGFLHAYEVLTIPLNCDLVTLSGCQTGAGRLYAGEGIVGLTRAFFHAGARQAVVSLWSVNDASTATLMERFYAGMSGGLDAAEALREAKLALRRVTIWGPEGRATSCSHPFFWAPFILIGTTPTT